jgi:hypothetical protein
VFQLALQPVAALGQAAGTSTLILDVVPLTLECVNLPRKLSCGSEIFGPDVTGSPEEPRKLDSLFSITYIEL